MVVLFDIDRINIWLCIESKCNFCRKTQTKTTNQYGEQGFRDVWYCKLDLKERYYKCPLFLQDVERITDIDRFEVIQATTHNGNKIKNLEWIIFDNHYGHMVDVLPSWDYTDKDKADACCKWLNELNDSYDVKSVK